MNDIWVPVTIASVVEGEGERYALPRLLHRIAAELGVDLRTPKQPFRIPRSKLVTPGEIERAVNAQASEVTGAGGILVLLDADDDCPAQLGPQLLTRARAARSTSASLSFSQSENSKPGFSRPCRLSLVIMVFPTIFHYWTIRKRPGTVRDG